MARKSKTRKSKANPQTPPQDPTKRASMTTLGLYGLGAVVIGGGGTAFARDFMHKMKEQDLTRIGQGTPVVVQVHDPNCGLCRALQRETRAALKGIDEDAVLYLVANITSTEGAAFAAERGLSHVTLVLLDEQGALQHTIEGVTPAATIARDIARHLGAGA